MCVCAASSMVLLKGLKPTLKPATKRGGGASGCRGDEGDEESSEWAGPGIRKSQVSLCVCLCVSGK